MEYWPRGMEAISGNATNECVGETMLSDLVAAGYVLYSMPMKSHLKAPRDATLVSGQARVERPSNDLLRNCQWYLNLEKEYQDPSYKMGYWSDIVAVSPKAMVENPQTEVTALRHRE
jgi:hypothetical protein